MKNEPPTHVLGLAHPPIPVVRIGFIGLGTSSGGYLPASSSHSDVYHVRWTRWAAASTAVGGNNQSALMLGINVKRTKFMSHLIFKLLVEIGGYVYFLHVGSGSASHANGMEYERHRILHHRRYDADWVVRC